MVLYLLNGNHWAFKFNRLLNRDLNLQESVPTINFEFSSAFSEILSLLLTLMQENPLTPFCQTMY